MNRYEASYILSKSLQYRIARRITPAGLIILKLFALPFVLVAIFLSATWHAFISWFEQIAEDLSLISIGGLFCWVKRTEDDDRAIAEAINFLKEQNL